MTGMTENLTYIEKGARVNLERLYILEQVSKCPFRLATANDHHTSLILVVKM